MKKTYIIPEMEIVKVETQQVIAASVGFGDGNIDPSAIGAPEMGIPDLPGVQLIDNDILNVIAQ